MSVFLDKMGRKGLEYPQQVGDDQQLTIRLWTCTDRINWDAQVFVDQACNLRRDAFHQQEVSNGLLYGQSILDYQARRFHRTSLGFVPTHLALSLIHISEPTRLGMISYAVFC